MPAANGQPGAGRGFVPGYTVKYRGSQKAEDRFGFECREEISDMLRDHENVPYPQGFSGQWDDFPRVARARMNLTALSQHYDLYLVAYKGFVQVYRLGRGVKVALGEPLAILDPNMSKTGMSTHVAGDINPRCAHEINHMVVGGLGDQEVVVVSRDNGDVQAWYTATVAEHIQRVQCARRGRAQASGGGQPADKVPRQPHLRHFFSENVGASAWGLAVHEKSRLIAVSSNCHEVTVFAFALTSPRDAVKVGHRCASKCEGHIRQTETTANEATQQICMLKQRLQARRRTWRIVLSFGVEACNMPSIAFCDDAHGNATRVAAIDINGYLYVADIWQVARKPIRIPPHNVQLPSGRRYRQVRGWNLLAVTDAQLLPTKTVHAALGLQPHKCVYRAKTTRGAWQDTSRCMSEVWYDAASRRHKHRIAAYEFKDYSEDTDGISRDTFSLVDFEEPATITPPLSDDIWHPVYGPNDGIHLDEAHHVGLAMTVVPYSGAHFAEPATPELLVEFAGIRGAARRAHGLHVPLNIGQFRQNAQQWGGQDLLQDISFLRFNEEDFEMLSLAETDTGVVCHHVLDNVNMSGAEAPWDMAFGKRCSMLLTIPELHLVIVGSMCGRVALVTLTKPPHADTHADSATPRRAFRVDAVLPFQDEEETSERPFVCLLGIAVSPIPEPHSQGIELRRRQQVRKGRTRWIEPDSPKRWRLVLNYQDHTVMQYDIVKRDQGETGSWNNFAGSRVYSRRMHKAKGGDPDDDSDSSV
ncbi:hypothetical protein KVR01_000137 [Diaporthe batatas]|uniref:uncharacterized protein n=1 Tax=Diaporthe batatas TaxID=748121 RepID=UPI001D03EECD|nr:uncharacterized protein KVR01_000137 [Diaporthe batatas]KAG8169392.1 hypothetical protein KVR01_000137 [Diaporthe batatas]